MKENTNRIAIVSPVEGRTDRWQMKYVYLKNGKAYRTVKTNELYRLMTEDDRHIDLSETITFYDPSDFKPRKLVRINAVKKLKEPKRVKSPT